MLAAALREAGRARPGTEPPCGALLVRGSQVLARGHQRAADGTSAEQRVLAQAGHRARGATVYLSVAPHSRRGRSARCVEVLAAAGIARVVVGCPDPVTRDGSFTRRLRTAGIELVQAPAASREAAERALGAYRVFHTLRRPRVTLKAAVTLDGRIATRGGDSRWITSQRARKLAHRMRAESDAVLVGIGTAVADDPALTVRHVRGRQPLRVLLDSRLRVDPDSQLVKQASELPTLIFHGAGAARSRRLRLLASGAQLQEVPLAASGRGLDLHRVLGELAGREVVELLVEGGGRVHGGLLDAGLADRAAIFVAPSILADAAAQPLAHGAPKARIAEAHRLEHLEVRRLGPDTLFLGELLPP